MNFHECLKKLRKERKANQIELANLLDTSPRAFRFYESGDREPNIAGLIALADYFQLSLDYLVGRSDNPDIKK